MTFSLCGHSLQFWFGDTLHERERLSRRHMAQVLQLLRVFREIRLESSLFLWREHTLVFSHHRRRNDDIVELAVAAVLATSGDEGFLSDLVDLVLVGLKPLLRSGAATERA